MTLRLNGAPPRGHRGASLAICAALLSARSLDALRIRTRVALGETAERALYNTHVVGAADDADRIEASRQDAAVRAQYTAMRGERSTPLGAIAEPPR